MKKSLIANLEILRNEESGVSWIGTVSTLEDAHAQILNDIASRAEHYIIFNSTIGDRISVESRR
jgi:hypothetical protein